MTIRDVASRAGVSISTVSHALSGKRPIRAETRKRIQRVIGELGYEPNSAARMLSGGLEAAVQMDEGLVGLERHWRIVDASKGWWPGEGIYNGHRWSGATVFTNAIDERVPEHLPQLHAERLAW